MLILTDKLIGKICEQIREGMCYRDACILSGVDQFTGNKWRKQAREDAKKGKAIGESMYIKLAKAMDEAKDMYAQDLIKIVMKSGRLPKFDKA